MEKSFPVKVRLTGQVYVECHGNTSWEQCASSRCQAILVWTRGDESYFVPESCTCPVDERPLCCWECRSNFICDVCREPPTERQVSVKRKRQEEYIDELLARIEQLEKQKEEEEH